MQYTTTLPFHGDAEKALGLAQSALAALGFESANNAAGSVEMIGPGMNSTRRSALLGASRIRLVCRRSELALEAELGGVARMSRFVKLFPIGLVLLLGLTLSAVFSTLFGPGIWLVAVAAAVVGNAVVWLLLGPVIARSVQSRTHRALDALLASMVAAGESQ